MTSMPSAGTAGVMAKLSELIFIEALRWHAASLPQGTGGWLTAANDPSLGRALSCLRDAPGRDWTVATLARAAGVSRTVLSERFVARLGVPPMTYLTRWRMQLAAGLLRDGRHSLAQIAERIGYRTEPAFSRAFKRETGLSPSAWRRRFTAEEDARRQR